MNVQQAADLIHQSNVVAIPTDTVYGLAASVTSKQAIRKVFALKQRLLQQPLIILVASLEQAKPFIKEHPPGFDQLTHKFWPGPLTLVVPSNVANTPEVVRSGLNTIGLRIPNHPLALELLEKTGPLAVSSANPSGKAASRSAEEIRKYFGYQFPVLDGGECPQRVASTILVFEEGEWVISREGMVRKQDLPL